MLVRIERHPNGPRLHVGRLRVHHWMAGVGLVAVGGWFIWWDRADLWG